ncbi:MAG TPA: metal-sulfur cluster assembly factor [Elusimicrobiota bacterium]|nr:metal-sulfur cluster assembly factor [Elusimicrobiota bacterium]
MPEQTSSQTQASSAPAAAISFKQVGEALQPVFDPEIHMSIVDLGLVYGAEIKDSEKDGAAVIVRMSLTSPACPYGPMLLAMVHGAVAKIPGVRDVDVNLSFEPPWDPRVMASEEAKDQMGIF